MNDKVKMYFSNYGWKLSEKDISASKDFNFDNFKLALSWMVEVGIEADKLDHHPNWRNIYNKIEVELQTHDVGALTNKDVELAEYMDAAFKKFL